MGCGGYWKFQGDQLGILFAYVGQGVGGAAFCPGYVSGFELNLRRALAFDVAAQIEIGHGYDQMRAGVMVFGDNSAGLQFEVGDAHAVFYEQDVAGAAVQDVQASFLIPWGRGRVAGFLVLQEFDDHVAGGPVGQIFAEVGEAAGNEAGFAVLQRELDWRLSGDVVFHLRYSQGHGDVVVAVTVRQGDAMGRDFQIEHADILVFEHQMMMGLGGDIDFGGGGLRGQQEAGSDDKDKDKNEAEPAGLHGARF